MAQPLTINARFESRQLLLRLEKGHKRLAYAAVNAINKTAKLAQREVRQEVEAEFEVRKTEFIKREAAKIKPFASVKQGRAFADISVGQKPRLLLSAFERGAVREPVTPGATFVAEPVIGGPARPDFRSAVTPEFRMSRLRFDRTSTGRIRAAQKRTSTFLIPTVGIFQRLAGEASRAVYIFTRGKRLEDRLRFEQTVKRIANKWLARYFEREVDKALEFAKARRG